MDDEMRKIVYLLADKQARDTILNVCAVENEGGFLWRNTERLTNCLTVLWEVKYLRMRGLLAHHKEKPHLVKLKGFCEAQPIPTDDTPPTTQK